MEILRACHDSPELLEQVLSSLNHGIILSDLEGGILFANRVSRRILGYHDQDLAGRSLSLIFMPDDLTYLYPNLLHLASLGQSFEGELMLRRRDESGFFAYLTLNTCQSGEDQPLLVLGLEDIDQQKRLEKMLGRTPYQDLIIMAENIAHEIRNPLVGIGGFVNRLYKSCRVDVDKDQYYRHIIDNLSRIEGLVKKVRELVSLPEPHLSRESTRELMEQAIRGYLERIEQKRVAVINQVQEIKLRVDRELMIKGFGILLENSLDFVPEGGRILVSGGRDGDNCRMVFSDNGPGIAPEDLPFIFNPFFSTKADGVGIDLAVLKRIVEIHGGNIQAEPRSQGAAFHLELPLERRRRIRTCRLGQAAAE